MVRKKARYVLGIVLLLLAVGWYFYEHSQGQIFSSPQVQTASVKLKLQAQPNQILNETLSVKPQMSPEQLSEMRSKVWDWLSHEANTVGQVDDNPQETKKKISEFANRLGIHELEFLGQLSLDSKITEDARFLASFVLAESANPSAIQVLGQLALAPYDDTSSAHSLKGSLEWMVRGRAVEGFEKFAKSSDEVVKQAAVHQLLKIIDNSKSDFLRDRAHRVLAAAKIVEGQPTAMPSSIEDIDKDALKKAFGGK